MRHYSDTVELTAENCHCSLNVYIKWPIDVKFKSSNAVSIWIFYLAIHK